MHQTLLTFAIIGYVAATGLALAYLVQREEVLHRLASLATLAAWVLHTIALLALAIDLGRPPLASLPDAVSVAVWVVVLLEMWLERRYGLSGLGAFVLPVALVFSLQSMPTRPLIGPTLSGAWLLVHIGLALVGIAAFLLNFAAAVVRRRSGSSASRRWCSRWGRVCSSRESTAARCRSSSRASRTETRRWSSGSSSPSTRTSCASCSAISPAWGSSARPSSSRPAIASRCTRSPTCPARPGPPRSASSAATAAWSRPPWRRFCTRTPRATRFATRSAWRRASTR